MGNNFWLKALTLVLGVVIACLLLSQKSGIASPQPPVPDGRFQLNSGETVVAVKPGVFERRPAVLRIDTQTGNTWVWDTTINKWKMINNP